MLHNLCQVVTSIGLLAFVFGQSYAGTLLYLYGGSDFVAGGLPETLLRWHCVAIILLSVNGITEGFMFATNTSRDIDTYNYYMAFFSVTFLALSYVLTNALGPVGFILANCTNMAFRIAYSTWYIGGQFRSTKVANPLMGIVPGKWFVAVLAACGLVCKLSEVCEVDMSNCAGYSRFVSYFQAYLQPISILQHLVVGVVCTLLSVATWVYENKHLFDLMVRKYKQRRDSVVD